MVGARAVVSDRAVVSARGPCLALPLRCAQCGIADTRRNGRERRLEHEAQGERAGAGGRAKLECEAGARVRVDDKGEEGRKDALGL